MIVKAIKRNHAMAFSAVELLIVVVVLALLVITQFPAGALTKAGSERLTCGDNLRRISVAFREWAANHQDRLPMHVAPAEGGAHVSIGLAATLPWTGGPNPNANRGVYWMFAVMSNELATPKVLFCPAENSLSHDVGGATISQAEVFGPQLPGGPAGFQNDYNISYFVGVDANYSGPRMLLTGDHNLGTGPDAFTKINQFVSAGTNANWSSTAIGWQDNNHRKEGNVAFIDGSVQTLNTAQFRSALNNSGDFGRVPGIFLTAQGSSGAGINRLQFP